MNILATTVIVGWVVFLGGMIGFSGKEEGEKPYAILFAVFFVVIASSLMLALGTLGLLPELVW
jgi:hypothetical protein